MYLTITEKYDVDFDGLRDKVDGQAADIMDEVAEAGLEEEFMDWLVQIFNIDIEDGEPSDLDTIWDYIRFDWQDIYNHIGLEY
jgi:hypothetical protein